MRAFILFAICILIIILYIYRPVSVFEDMLILDTPDSEIKIYGNHRLAQRYVPRYRNLSKIGFFVFRDKPKNNDLILHIKSQGSDKDLLKLAAKGPELYTKRYPFKLPPLHREEGSMYFFEFEPLEYLQGDELYFYLESPESKEGDAITIGGWKNIFDRGNAGGESFYDGVPWDKQLAFESYYRMNGNLSDTFKDVFKRVIRDREFIIFYLILCISLLSGIIFINFKLRYAR